MAKDGNFTHYVQDAFYLHERYSSSNIIIIIIIIIGERISAISEDTGETVFFLFQSYMTLLLVVC